MKQSTKKLTRGQMVYAPISSSENRSRSPFSQNKNILINSRSQQPQLQQQKIQKPTIGKVQQSPQSPFRAYQISNLPSNSISPYHQYQQQVQNLIKQNSQLKARQQIYISKLLKLQQGLQKQHQQFMNLQQLYTDLFNVYKQKQQEIAQLQLKYKQTQRSRTDFNSINKKDLNNSLMSIDKIHLRNIALQQNFKNQLTQLIFQNKRLNQTNQKLISELNYLKSKQKLNQSKQTLQQKVFQELNDWQKQADSQKQQKIKLQYQNKFFKMRNQDLQKTISELENIISMKQTQIIKMRQQKFAIRRQSSEKVLNRSPPRSNIDSARSKGSNQDSKKFVKLIQNLQKQNHQLREQNLLLKQKLKSNIFHKQSNVRLNDSFYSNGSQNYANLQKRLQFVDNENKINSNPLRGYQNQNFNSQNINQQYFSFSRQKQQRQQQQDLPSFPMDLQIEGIIRKYEDNKNEINIQKRIQKQIQKNKQNEVCV